MEFKKKVIIIFKCLCWIICGKIKNNLHPFCVLVFFLPTCRKSANLLSKNELKLLLPELKPTKMNQNLWYSSVACVSAPDRICMIWGDFIIPRSCRFAPRCPRCHRRCSWRASELHPSPPALLQNKSKVHKPPSYSYARQSSWCRHLHTCLPQFVVIGDVTVGTHVSIHGPWRQETCGVWLQRGRHFTPRSNPDRYRGGSGPPRSSRQI